MSKPGFYAETGVALTLRDILNLPPGTVIKLHTHLANNRFRAEIDEARRQNGLFSIIPERKTGTLSALSDLLLPEHHTGHDGQQIVCTARNFTIELSQTIGDVDTPLRAGMKKGTHYKRKPEPPPAWLSDKPVFHHHSH